MLDLAHSLFERHPHYLRLFVQDPPDNESLHEFSTHTLEFLRRIIEVGMDNEDLYQQLVSDYVRLHLALGLAGKDIYVGEMIWIYKCVCVQRLTLVAGNLEAVQGVLFAAAAAPVVAVAFGSH